MGNDKKRQKSRDGKLLVETGKDRKRQRSEAGSNGKKASKREGEFRNGTGGRSGEGSLGKSNAIEFTRTKHKILLAKIFICYQAYPGMRPRMWKHIGSTHF